MKTEIFRTEMKARQHAKYVFAGILGISAKSVTVEHDKYCEARYGSTTCVCGETICNYYRMKNAGPRQLAKLERKINRAGAVIALGVCGNCGQN